MSGVIDKSGQQWEHCNECGKFVRIQWLRYEKPSIQFPCGRDLCRDCARDAAELAGYVVISRGDSE